jgi:hypothetical protein
MANRFNSGQVSDWGVDRRTIYGPTIGQEASGNKPGVISVPNTFYTSAANTTYEASRLYLIPFVVDKPLTITKWYLRVVTNAVGNTSTVRAGIYNLRSTLELGPLVTEFPSLSIATAATGENITALSSPLVLQPGLYALSWVVSSASLTVRAAASTTLGYSVIAAVNSLVGSISGGANSAPIASALPDPGPVLQINTAASSGGTAVWLIWSYE